MKKIILSVFVLLILTSCKENDPKTADFDYGTIENGVYKNNYFNFEMPVNDKWFPKSKKDRILMSSKTKKTENKSDKSPDVKGADVKNAVLFSIAKFPAEAVQTANPSMFINSVNLEGYPNIKSPSDYIAMTRQMLDNTPLILVYKKEPYSKTIDGVEFQVMEIFNQDYEVTQEYLATLRNGFAISLVMAYTSEMQKEELYIMLDQLKFK